MNIILYSLKSGVTHTPIYYHYSNITTKCVGWPAVIRWRKESGCDTTRNQEQPGATACMHLLAEQLRIEHRQKKEKVPFFFTVVTTMFLPRSFNTPMTLKQSTIRASQRARFSIYVRWNLRLDSFARGEPAARSNQVKPQVRCSPKRDQVPKLSTRLELSHTTHLSGMI